MGIKIAAIKIIKAIKKIIAPNNPTIVSKLETQLIFILEPLETQLIPPLFKLYPEEHIEHTNEAGFVELICGC
jgi:hypothetical protein